MPFFFCCWNSNGPRRPRLNVNVCSSSSGRMYFSLELRVETNLVPNQKERKKKRKKRKKEEEGRAFFLYSNTSRDEYRGPPNTFGSPCLYIYIYNISTHFSSFFFSFSPHLAHQHFSLFFLCFSIPNKENICIGNKKTWGKERK